ncbi:MAG: iron-containing alcohol dehydrogenase [Oscillospiraceae bacterium]|jgi:alcohol dehydrogenase YqhD (iron-dependent ADH family)|nr:iron-containing alcohol dehydrogenase [Oscillospiraceae bacterium]
MLNFNYRAPTRLIFGKGAQHKVGETLKPLTQKLLLHYGGQSVKKSGLYDEVVASLKGAGVSFVELGGAVPNPRLSLVHEGIDLCRREGVDMILAVGGGSAIDSAKAIALGFYHEGDVWEIYAGEKKPQKALPVATVLTIPAAGSEASPSSVITNEALQIKKGHTTELIQPVVSFINPELFFTLPKSQMGYGVADMMSHIFERYFTQTIHTDLTDALCEGTLRTILKNAPLLVDNPQDYDAWFEIGFAGTIAHINLLGLGRAQDWGCHDMEHELSAIYDVAHGGGLAVLTPSWMRYVYKENVGMFVQFAVNVMGVEGSYREPDAIVEEGIARLQAFFRRLGLPTTLRELGIGEENLELMAKKATEVAYGKEERRIGGFKKLGWQDVLNIYHLAQ